MDDTPFEEEPFVPPHPETPYLLLDSGTTITYREMCAGIDPRLLPTDETSLEVLLDTFGVAEVW